MSGPFGSQQWMYASGGFYSHPIDQSLRFNDNDSAYLSRTPASVGNRKTWTWSGWVKRGGIGTTDTFFAGIQNDSNRLVIGFNTDSDITVVDVTSGSATTYLQSNAQFRDPSAWYHFVVALDTTESTASNRLKIYVNGSELTSYSTDNRSSITLNGDEHINNTISHTIGTNRATGITYYNGYLAEINFVDGQALNPTSFGENKSGVWIPKRYSGSYGTNGFYLDFGNSGSLGADSSGNGNNWTPNNLVATDQVLDSPTNNFFTLSPINALASGFALSEGNTKVSGSNASRPRAKAGSAIPTSGSWYWEILVNTQNNNQLCLGITSSPVSVGAFPDQTGDHGFRDLEAGWNAGDIVSFRLNSSDFLLSYSVNGGSWTTASRFGTPSTTLPNFVLVQIDGSSTETVTLNFGQDSSFAGQKTAQGNTDANGIGDFYYSPPSGYLALCTANLPDPVAAIDPALDANPQDYFNTVLYTGDGSTLASGGQDVTGVGFDPDIVWLKHRDEANDHHVYDQVRGDYNRLFPNGIDLESTGGRLSFITDGFNVSDYDNHNKLNGLFASWNWKAGGTGVSNTVGTLTSTVSANQDLGVSIVTFTTDGTNSNAGTGLSSSAPLDMVIIKRRDSTSEWQVGHRFSGQGSNFAYHLELNSSSALSGSSPYFMGTQSSTNGDRVYLSSGSYGVSSATWVAYCFQEVDGFSKFGSYTGNGSTDGPFVYCGFRPAFVMIKPTTANHWRIQDGARDNYNPSDKELFPNLSNAEVDNPTDYAIDFVSNGFKFRTAFSGLNLSGTAFIFMAFAEMPFKYANAR